MENMNTGERELVLDTFARIARLTAEIAMLDNDPDRPPTGVSIRPGFDKETGIGFVYMDGVLIDSDGDRASYRINPANPDGKWFEIASSVIEDLVALRDMLLAEQDAAPEVVH